MRGRSISSPDLDKGQLNTLLILCGLLVFLIANNYIVFFEDGLVFTDHERMSYVETFEQMESYKTTQLLRPPLYHYTTALLFSLFGPSLSVALITNQILLVIFVAYNYKLGKYLFDRGIGIISTIFATTVPLFFALSRFYHDRFAAVALMPLVIYYMLKSDGFSNARNTAIFTVSFIVAAYFRYDIVNFVIPLLIVYLFKERKAVEKNIKNVVSMSSVLLVWGLLLIEIFRSERIGHMVFGEARLLRGFRMTELFIRYIGNGGFSEAEILAGLGTQLRPLYIYIFIAALAYFLYRTYHSEERFVKVFTLLWLSLSILIYTQLFGHQPFFQLLPIFIPASYIAAYGIVSLDSYLEGKGLKRNVVSASFALLFLTNFLLISYGVEAYYPEEMVSNDFVYQNYEFRYNPREEDYRTIFEEINEFEEPRIGIFLLDGKGPNTRLWPFSDHGHPGGHIYEAKNTEIIPAGTKHYTGENLTEIRRFSNVIIATAPYDYTEGKWLDFDEKIGEDWEEIESFLVGTDEEYKVKFYKSGRS